MYTLKQKLLNNQLTIGSWISFGFTQTCEIMSKAKFDWLVIDMEHTAIDGNQCLSLIQIIEANGVVVKWYPSWDLTIIKNVTKYDMILSRGLNDSNDKNKIKKELLMPSRGFKTPIVNLK